MMLSFSDAAECGTTTHLDSSGKDGERDEKAEDATTQPATITELGTQLVEILEGKKLFLCCLQRRMALDAFS